MKLQFAAPLLLLSAFSAPSAGEVIDLVCTLPGNGSEHRLVIDTEQRAVLQDGRRGTIVKTTGDVIHYFLKFRGRIQANRLDLADGTVDMAIARPTPEVGYDRRRMTCRRI